MIFSIILIIAFIVFAFYAIRKFLDFQDTINIEKFGEGLQSDIDNLWKGSDGSQEVEYTLPSKISAVCFRKDEYENLYFEPKNIFAGKEIEHLNILSILNGETSACFDNIHGKVKMTLKKSFGEVLVTISH